MRVIKKPTVKKTTTKTSSSTTKPSSSSSSSSSNSSNTNTSYNDILNKLNDYVLKSSITNFVTNETLAAAISNIKQCNCEPSTNTTPTPTQTTDNTALNDLIRKLNNYGIFQYDVAGKETIVTEFFPRFSNNTSGNYADGYLSYGLPQNWQILMTMAQNNNNTVNDFDFFYIKTPTGNKTVNSLSFAKYFRKTEENGSIFYVINAAILKEPITVTTNNSIKTITLFWAWDELRSAAGYISSNPTDELSFDGPSEIPVEFMPSLIFTKNGITCEFNGSENLYNESNYITGGTITLTLPENVSLVNTEPNGTYNISVNSNKITINLYENARYYPLTKQIIIADSSTKRYVIKINGEAKALPPNY